MVWSIATPDGSEAASQGDDRIRELKTDLQGALRGNDTDGVEAKFPGSDTANPIYRYRGLKGPTGSRGTAGQYGMFFDETRNVLQRDNGTSWEDIATVIPAGTVMVFYQAAAPVGWTKITSQDDKALRVVSGAGGGGGGSHGLSTYSTHVHATVDHTLTVAEMPSHHHRNGAFGYLLQAHIGGSNDTGTSFDSNDSGGNEPNIITKDQTASNGGDLGHNHGNTLGSTQIAYVDVILCSKT